MTRFLSTLTAAVGLVVAASSTASAVPDATASLQAQFDAARPGDTITLAPRVYEHSGVLRLPASGVTVNGNGATLIGTRQETSALKVTGADVTIIDLRIANPSTRRWFAPDQHALVLDHSTGTTLTGVTIDGSAGAGIFVYGTSNFTITNPRVANTRADGIHMTNGSSGGRVVNPVTRATGDDGVAVVSYRGEALTRGISVSSPVVQGTRWGRGLSVVGGRDITYSNVSVRDTNAAGIYVATEPSYNTLSVDNVTVAGGTVLRGNLNPSVVNGAVLVYGGNRGEHVAGVTLRNLLVAATPSSADRSVGVLADPGGSVTDIRLDRVAVVGRAAEPFLVAVPGAVSASRLTVNAAPYTLGRG